MARTGRPAATLDEWLDWAVITSESPPAAEATDYDHARQDPDGRSFKLVDWRTVSNLTSERDQSVRSTNCPSWLRRAVPQHLLIDPGIRAFELAKLCVFGHAAAAGRTSGKICGQ